MPKFLERLDEREIAYRLHDRRTKGDAHVRQHWFRNERQPAKASSETLDSRPQVS